MKLGVYAGCNLRDRSLLILPLILSRSLTGSFVVILILTYNAHNFPLGRGGVTTRKLSCAGVLPKPYYSQCTIQHTTKKSLLWGLLSAQSFNDSHVIIVITINSVSLTYTITSAPQEPEDTRIADILFKIQTSAL